MSPGKKSLTRSTTLNTAWKAQVDKKGLTIEFCEQYMLRVLPATAVAYADTRDVDTRASGAARRDVRKVYDIVKRCSMGCPAKGAYALRRHTNDQLWRCDDEGLLVSDHRALLARAAHTHPSGPPPATAAYRD